MLLACNICGEDSSCSVFAGMFPILTAHIMLYVSHFPCRDRGGSSLCMMNTVASGRVKYLLLLQHFPSDNNYLF